MVLFMLILGLLLENLLIVGNRIMMSGREALEETSEVIESKAYPFENMSSLRNECIE